MKNYPKKQRFIKYYKVKMDFLDYTGQVVSDNIIS